MILSLTTMLRQKRQTVYDHHSQQEEPQEKLT